MSFLHLSERKENREYPETLVCFKADTQAHRGISQDFRQVENPTNGKSVQTPWYAYMDGQCKMQFLVHFTVVRAKSVRFVFFVIGLLFKVFENPQKL